MTGLIFGHRVRRLNPGFGGLLHTGLAVLAGLGASVGLGYVIDKFMPAQSSTVQTAVLAGGALAAAVFIPSAVISAGVATGLLVVPLAKMVYGALPALANPVPAGTPPATPSSVVPAPTSSQISALQQARFMGALQPRGSFGISALQQGRRIGALQPAGRGIGGILEDDGMVSARGSLRHIRGSGSSF